MNYLLLLGQVAILLAIGAVGLVLSRFLPSYMAKKAENLATKEDIADITHRVEAARLEHLAALERVKVTLSDESSALLRRRETYDHMVKALRIFLAGTEATTEQKQSFLEHYQSLWLWAPDDVIRAVNQFLDVNRRFAATPTADLDNQQKRAFAEIILAMRRNIGYAGSELHSSDYQFVRFSNAGTA